MNKGKLYIISAPSGAGKTSLVKQLTADVDQLTVSISHTTRGQRAGEQDGQDYFFIAVEQFKKMINEGAFLEYAQVFDNFYGTSQQAVIDNLHQGIDVILEIDWQGAQQIREMLPDCISIFILPPSTEILEQRLRSRAQDSEDVIARRMHDAVTEISHYPEFDYMVVNDDFNVALNELKSIIITQRLQQGRQAVIQRSLLESLLN